MELQRINILLKRYFDAETTLVEENELISYFHSDSVEESLKQYIPLFKGMKECGTFEIQGYEDDLMNYILESEHRRKGKYRLRWLIVTTAAASVIMAILAVNFYSQPRSNTIIIDNPQDAYEEASKAFKYLTINYAESMAELAPLRKVVDAADPLRSGVSTINKGLNEMREIKRINNEFKNN
jgi:hypothetical protein